MDFDEQDAINFMQENSGIETKYSDDQLLNIIDIIWDYYEDKGLLDISLDDNADSEADNNDLIRHVKKMLRKDRRAGIAESDIEPLVMAEIAYEASLEE